MNKFKKIIDSDDSFSEEDIENATLSIYDRANKIREVMIPKKSSSRYHIVYNEFLAWCQNQKINKINEDAILVYLEEISKTCAPTTLYNRISMLKRMLKINQDINIDECPLIKVYLRDNVKGYEPKKSKTLTWQQITTFLDTACDQIYLGVKVCLVLGIAGCLRCCELHGLKIQHIEDDGSSAFIEVRDTKNYLNRSFIVEDQFYDIYRRYTALRAPDTPIDQFLVNYQQGKCTRQPIGKKKIAKMPSVIACYLNLPNADSYTGHCFRRTAATLLANTGASMTTIKRHGGWKSAQVAEGYIADSKETRRRVFRQIMNYRDCPSAKTTEPPKEILKTSEKITPESASRFLEDILSNQSKEKVNKRSETITSEVQNRADSSDFQQSSMFSTSNQAEVLAANSLAAPQGASVLDEPQLTEHVEDVSHSESTRATYAPTPPVDQENFDQEIRRRVQPIKLKKCTIHNFTINYNIFKED